MASNHQPKDQCARSLRLSYPHEWLAAEGGKQNTRRCMLNAWWQSFKTSVFSTPWKQQGHFQRHYFIRHRWLSLRVKYIHAVNQNTVADVSVAKCHLRSSPVCIREFQFYAIQPSKVSSCTWSASTIMSPTSLHPGSTFMHLDFGYFMLATVAPLFVHDVLLVNHQVHKIGKSRSQRRCITP